MGNEKVVNISGRYSHEINEINNILHQLKNGRIYDLTDCKSDGYLSIHVQKLESKLNELISKIEFDQPGTKEIIGFHIAKLD